MKKSDLLLKIGKFEQARARLFEACEKAKDDLEIDGTIQRFEYTIELLWKALKALLAYEGIECYSPKNCIKEAFKAGLIEDDEIVLDMLDDRNAGSHIYDEATSRKIFERIKGPYLEYLERMKLKERV
ncbi:HI0074 family nucleotidyltransferase substrate-binding subunit [Hydrogenimonas sp.]